MNVDLAPNCSGLKQREPRKHAPKSGRKLVVSSHCRLWACPAGTSWNLPVCKPRTAVITNARSAARIMPAWLEFSDAEIDQQMEELAAYNGSRGDNTETRRLRKKSAGSGAVEGDENMREMRALVYRETESG